MVAHGLAATIRASEESESYDLGGQSATTIASTVESAFREPLTLKKRGGVEMIRITLVVGAGKQARQKYDPGAMRAVTSALVNCGYVEDRGASCVAECGGTYKIQHDTGKNLKTIVIFPRVVVVAKGEGADGGGGAGGASSAGEGPAEPLLPENSPGYKIATASTGVFENMLSSRCPSWSEKRGCLGSLEALSDMLREIDDRLIRGEPLDDAERRFYDDVVDLDEKAAIVRREMHAQVEGGDITEFERRLLLEQNAERIASLTREGKKPTARAMQRRELLESIDPVRPGRLRHEEDIRKLRKELEPLLQMEDAARGRLLTMKETQTLARKDDLLEEIAYLEESSQGWFEDDSAFESRLQASREVFETRRRQKAARTATIGADTRGKVSETKWVLPGERKGGTRGGGRKKNKIKGASAFSAMVLDSDDDEEQEEDDEDDSETNQLINNPKSGGEAEMQQSAASANQGTKKKARKKKKKQKSKEQDPGTEEQALMKTGARRDEIAVSQGESLLRTHILPLLTVLFGWLYALVFGKQKRHSRGRVKQS